MTEIATDDQPHVIVQEEQQPDTEAEKAHETDQPQSKEEPQESVEDATPPEKHDISEFINDSKETLDYERVDDPSEETRETSEVVMRAPSFNKGEQEGGDNLALSTQTSDVTNASAPTTQASETSYTQTSSAPDLNVTDVDEDSKPQEQKAENNPPIARQTTLQVRLTEGTITKDQFKFQGTLGQGAYGQVYLVTRKTSGIQYALKVLEKDHIVKYDKIESVFRERDIGQDLCGHPNIVQFEATFQDSDNLYFLLEYAEKGSLQGLLKTFKTLSADLARFYAAEIVSALHFMHEKKIAHRDLKPDNILLDKKYHAKVTDFGDSKQFIEEDENPEEEAIDESDERNSLFDDPDERRGQQPRGSFVGTPLYVAPEMLSDNVSSPASDLWALGCIIYQCRVGEVPFRGQFDYEVFKKISDRELTIPNELEPECVDIIDHLLQPDPKLRLGAGPPGSENDFEALKNHAFFKGINFRTLHQTAPPVPAERYSVYFNKKQDDDVPDLDKEVLELMSNPKSSSPQPKDSTPSASEEAANLEKERKKVIFEGVVQKQPKSFTARAPCRNLILTKEPRLYFTSTLTSDGREGLYKSDILLYSNLQVKQLKKEVFEIKCQFSGKTHVLSTSDTKLWIQHIQRVLLEKRAQEDFSSVHEFVKNK